MRLVIVLLAGLTAALGACVPAPMKAPVTPLDHLPSMSGGYFTIQSREADHLYHVYVRLPQDYARDPARRYPIVYLLDGDGLFRSIAGNHIYLTIDDKLPEAIVVGIAYGSFDKPVNRRHIDFMPPGPGIKPDEARIADFHRFLELELLPQVEGRYRADASKRILFGQSRGGALILYSAFTNPDLFWARIASNPSWTPGREIFFGAPTGASRRDLNLFIALGSEEFADRRALAEEWLAYWETRPTPWTLTRLDIPGGTHSADAGTAYRAALRRLFAKR